MLIIYKINIRFDMIYDYKKNNNEQNALGNHVNL